MKCCFTPTLQRLAIRYLSDYRNVRKWIGGRWEEWAFDDDYGAPVQVFWFHVGVRYAGDETKPNPDCLNMLSIEQHPNKEEVVATNISVAHRAR